MHILDVSHHITLLGELHVAQSTRNFDVLVRVHIPHMVSEGVAGFVLFSTLFKPGILYVLLRDLKVKDNG